MSLLIPFTLVTLLLAYFYLPTSLPVFSIASSLDIPYTSQNFTRIIAIGDIHGDFESFLEILRFSNASSADYVVQLGDCIDRGDDTIPILEYFIHNSTSNFYQIIGNHEAMNMVGRVDYVSQGDIDSFNTLHNRTQYFINDGKYGSYINTLNLTVSIGDVVFVHGGISPEIAQKHQTIDNINLEAKQTEMKTLQGIWGRNGPLWYRGYSGKPSANMCKELTLSLSTLGYSHMIMGHTVHDTIISRCNSQAILIDTGISKAMKGNLSALEILQLNGSTVSMRALYRFYSENIYSNVKII